MADNFPPRMRDLMAILRSMYGGTPQLEDSSKLHQIRKKGSSGSTHHAFIVTEAPRTKPCSIVRFAWPTLV